MDIFGNSKVNTCKNEKMIFFSSMNVCQNKGKKKKKKKKKLFLKKRKDIFV